MKQWIVAVDLKKGLAMTIDATVVPIFQMFDADARPTDDLDEVVYVVAGRRGRWYGGDIRKMGPLVIN